MDITGIFLIINHNANYRRYLLLWTQMETASSKVFCISVTCCNSSANADWFWRIKSESFLETYKNKILNQWGQIIKSKTEKLYKYFQTCVFLILIYFIICP